MEGKIIIKPAPERLPNMYFDGAHHKWVLRFAFKDILDYVAAQTSVDSQRNPEVGAERVLSDKDRDLVLVNLRGGVANVSVILARRMQHPAEYTADGVTFILEVGDNHDESMSHVLHMRIMDYLCQYAYVKWAGADAQILSPLEDEIRSAMHYRKHGILRRVKNLNF